MILNPSHKITISGLPPDVLDAYVKYKKGTRAIVSWVVQYGPPSYHGARSLPLKELARLTASLTGKVKHLPDVIHFHFRETIAARKRLSKYFRGNIDESADNVDTINHEHFTTSLTEIYEGLCTCCSKARGSCDNHSAESKRPGVGETIANRFERLAITEEQSEMVEKEISQPESCLECQEQAARTRLGPQKEVTLADDDLGNRFQVAIILQQIHERVSAIREIWTQAGNAKIHFTTAAFATNVAYADLMRLEVELWGVDDSINPSDMAQTCCTALKGNSPSGASHAFHEFVERLQATETALKHYTNEHQPIKIASCSTCMQRPSDYVQPAPSAHGTPDTSRLSNALVDNIMHFMTTKEPLSNIVKDSSPVYADMFQIMTRKEEALNLMRATFGLHVLSEGYQTYLLSSSTALAPAACRLAALKLAQQGAKSIGDILDDKTCFPCRCPQTLAHHLHNLQGDLTSYAQQRCWDLYFQSPWVAGNHILEMLDLYHYYGQKLFAYRHYVASVLHSYNVLQQLAGLEEIPLLEGLCDRFEATFFPGGRAKNSFRACWTRYIGARIKIKKGHRTSNQRDSWCMAIAPHAARRAAGLGIGEEARDSKDECLLFKIKQQGYHVSGKQWESMSAEAGPTSTLETVMSAIEEETYPKDAAVIPTARVNHFAVFATCVRIISTLSDASHTDPKEQGINCICFASALLEGADRIVSARRLGKVAGTSWTKKEREGVLELSVKAIQDEMCYEKGLWATKWLMDL